VFYLGGRYLVLATSHEFCYLRVENVTIKSETADADKTNPGDWGRLGEQIVQEDGTNLIRSMRAR
jgi:hypothetical protein